jgi:hypothetical protein
VTADPADRATWTLFEESYWLDAVASGDWQAFVVKNDGKVVGRLPIVQKVRSGIRAISVPTFTPWLGPWVRATGGKAANEVSHQHQVLTALISQLPKAQRILVPCAPEMTNLMAFHWAKFDLRLGYTHRLDDLRSEENLWNGLRSEVRSRCRKAEKLTVINRAPSLKSFIAVLEKTFKRQDMDIAKSFPVFERMDEVMAQRQQRTIYSAEDAQGRVHAAVYVVFDDRHSFYLAGGGDPELRDSGAHALAMWHAIKDSGARSKVFDFEGSMVPTIEHFVRGFGARQVPRFTAEKEVRALRMYKALKPK